MEVGEEGGRIHKVAKLVFMYVYLYNVIGIKASTTPLFFFCFCLRNNFFFLVFFSEKRILLQSKLKKNLKNRDFIPPSYACLNASEFIVHILWEFFHLKSSLYF